MVTPRKTAMTKTLRTEAEAMQAHRTVQVHGMAKMLRIGHRVGLLATVLKRDEASGDQDGTLPTILMMEKNVSAAEIADLAALLVLEEAQRAGSVKLGAESGVVIAVTMDPSHRST